MKLSVGAFLLSAGLGMAAVAAAEPYTDYTPQKGATQVTMIKVDPNHIDDYLTGLRQSWVLGEEMAKKHGVIDWYQVNVKLNAGAGANVVLIQHYPSLANFEPDKARDMAMLAEGRAMEPKDKSDARIAGFEKYRTFVSDDVWTSVDFPK
jgi:hypothetical protein